jgi:hypothetical protein
MTKLAKFCSETIPFDHDFKFSTNVGLVIDEEIVMELQKLIEMAW